MYTQHCHDAIMHSCDNNTAKHNKEQNTIIREILELNYVRELCTKHRGGVEFILMVKETCTSLQNSLQHCHGATTHSCDICNTTEQRKEKTRLFVSSLLLITCLMISCRALPYRFSYLYILKLVKLTINSNFIVRQNSYRNVHHQCLEDTFSKLKLLLHYNPAFVTIHDTTAEDLVLFDLFVV